MTLLHRCDACNEIYDYSPTTGGGGAHIYIYRVPGEGSQAKGLCPACWPLVDDFIRSLGK